MPPRHVYWTILIDGKPTAFRAHDREELLPTLNQLRRTNEDVAMRYFARGKLWESPDQAQWAAKHADVGREKRGREWRPGGEHRDPRARFDKPKGSSKHAQRDSAGGDRPRPSRREDERGEAERRTPRDRTTGAERRDRPDRFGSPQRTDSRNPRGASGDAGAGRPPAGGPRSSKAPWKDGQRSPKPAGPGGPRPWSGKPRDERFQDATDTRRPGGQDRPRRPQDGDRAWSAKPRDQRGSETRPWSGGKPPRSGDQRPWSGEKRPRSGDPRPWSGGKPPRSREQQAWSGEKGPRSQERQPWSGEKRQPSGGQRPWSGEKRAGSGDKRPWSGDGRPRSGDKQPWSGGPRRDRDRAQADRSWGAKPAAEGRRPDQPRFEQRGSGERRPWSGRPGGDDQGQRPPKPSFKERPQGGRDRERAGGPRGESERRDGRRPRQGSSNPGGASGDAKPWSGENRRPGGGSGRRPQSEGRPFDDRRGFQDRAGENRDRPRRKGTDIPDERLEAEPRPTREPSASKPPTPGPVVTKPKPPERG